MFWKKKEKHSIVHDVRIASPCKADWNQMEGDERTRHCGMCKLNVYNISEMTTQDAEKLLTETTGRVCIRLFRRKDGTVMTKDCPVGLRAVRLKIATIYGAGLAAVSVALAYVLNKPLAQGLCGTDSGELGWALPKDQFRPREAMPRPSNSYETGNVTFPSVQEDKALTY